MPQIIEHNGVKYEEVSRGACNVCCFYIFDEKIEKHLCTAPVPESNPTLFDCVGRDCFYKIKEK